MLQCAGWQLLIWSAVYVIELAPSVVISHTYLDQSILSAELVEDVKPLTVDGQRRWSRCHESETCLAAVPADLRRPVTVTAVAQ